MRLSGVSGSLEGSERVQRTRSRALGGILILTSCIAMQTVVVAPRPVVRSDSAARAAFAKSAMAAHEQVARADSLEPHMPQDQLGVWTSCFQHPPSLVQLDSGA